MVASQLSVLILNVANVVCLITWAGMISLVRRERRAYQNAKKEYIKMRNRISKYIWSSLTMEEKKTYSWGTDLKDTK